LLPVLAAAAVEPPDEPEHHRIRQVLAERGACFFRELAVDDRVTLDALWDLVWAGEVTNDSFAAVRALSAKRRGGGKPRGGRPRLGSLAALGPPTAQGRWSLVSRELAGGGPAGADAGRGAGAGAGGGPGAALVSSTESATALAGTLLERYGVLTREAVRGEGVPGGFARVYPVLRAMEEAGRIRRGYFVAGLGGAQFALPGAVDRLRAFREGEAEGQPGAVVLAATDPANPYGVALPWPAKGPQRAAGAFVVLVGGLASLYVERGGKGLVALRAYDGTWEDEAVAALGGLLAEGRFKRLTVEHADPELEPRLHAAGFVPTPKGLVRYA
ncbi:MAG TPA: DEAD/DEAH box helicase, partial [Acidimicrobiales bacterium]|jgi:ATP-dependent Lhr-like helicase|nr:DEAD/DEAH box helicase [Acidimicrobiales bacterium]